MSDLNFLEQPLPESRDISKFAFPYDDDAPADLPEGPCSASVAGDIGGKLAEPELPASLGGVRVLALRMTVPEAAMHKDDGLIARQDDVGASWQVAPMQPKTEPFTVQK